MDRIQVQLARALFILPAGIELSTGRFSFQAATRLLVERYGFTKSPQTLEDWHSPEGARFTQGTFEGAVVMQLVLYSAGFAVDTATDTDDSDRCIRDLLATANSALNLSLPSPRPEDLGYVSQLTFRADLPLGALHPALQSMGQRVTQRTRRLVPGLRYEPSAITLKLDDSNLKTAPAPFTIERRFGVPFSENIYYSSGPVTTTAHVEILTEFEAAMGGVATAPERPSSRSASAS